MSAAVPVQPAQAQPQHGGGGGGGGGTAASSSTAGGASASAAQGSASGPGVSRSSASASAAPWKGDGQDVEETVKTRRNALRVIVQKMRNFWPADMEARLTERATLLEKGVYDATNSKQDYIQRLQRDLSLLNNRRDNEKKAMRLQMQQAGESFAQYAQEDKSTGMVAPNLSADARAKFAQKIYTMEKKHQNKFILLKMTDERLKSSPQELQMKKLLERFKGQYSRREKGPFDLKELNDIDHQLDRQQAAAPSPAVVRVTPSRETADKQNDRTQQIGQRMGDKMRKLNRERPLVIAELSWTIERDGPFTEPAPPPELAFAVEECKRDMPICGLSFSGMQKRPSPSERETAKRAKHESGKHAESREYDIRGKITALDGEEAIRLCPHRSSGGDFVPSVRDLHFEAAPASKGKGFTDAEAPNDTDSGEQQALAEHRQASHSHGTLPLTQQDAGQRLKHTALTISHPDFLAPAPLPDGLALGNCSHGGAFVVRMEGSGGCLLRQRGQSLGSDGKLHQHEVVIEVPQLPPSEQIAEGGGSSGGEQLAWDAKCPCLRSLPVRMTVTPDCLLDVGVLLAGSAETRRQNPAVWLREAVGGVARHLQCLNTVTQEVQQLLAAHGGLLSAAIVKRKQGSGFLVKFECCAGGMPLHVGMIVTVLPGLGTAEGYPNAQPEWELTGLARGLQSDKHFRYHFRKALDVLPAPVSLTDLAEKMLDTCGKLLLSDFSF